MGGWTQQIIKFFSEHAEDAWKYIKEMPPKERFAYVLFATVIGVGLKIYSGLDNDKAGNKQLNVSKKDNRISDVAEPANQIAENCEI